MQLCFKTIILQLSCYNYETKNNSATGISSNLYICKKKLSRFGLLLQIHLSYKHTTRKAPFTRPIYVKYMYCACRKAGNF